MVVINQAIMGAPPCNILTYQTHLYFHTPEIPSSEEIQLLFHSEYINLFAR